MWSYASVFRKQGQKNNKGDGKELCDLLVVCGDNVIIFSDKDCEFPNTGNLDLDWSRWYRKAIVKSAHQIWGVERWLLSYSDLLFLDRSCTKPFPFKLPSCESIKIHRVLVAHSASKRCQQELGGSGSLIIKSNIVGDQHIAKTEDGGAPFALGQIDPAHGYVHIFDDTTLDIVLNELDTITDFVEYLNKKEHFIASNKVVLAAGEEEMLAWYVTHMNAEGEHDFPSTSEIEVHAFLEGSWEDCLNNPQYRAKLAANKDSYFWDELIENCTRHAFAGTSEFVYPPVFASHELALRLLAQERRTQRRLLAKSFLQFVRQTPAHFRGTRTNGPTSVGEPCYVFLVLPHKKGLPYKKYREYRRNLLQRYCVIAKLEFPECQNIIGLATESGRSGPGSEDITCFDTSDWTPEHFTNANEIKQLLITEGLLTPQRKHSVQEQEYPDVPTVILSSRHQSHPEMKGRDRNAPCWCGSGKKFKKCHG